MRKVTDIRQYKTGLREKYKKIRLDMPADVKLSADKKICSRVKSLFSYKNCDTIFIYVSTPIEVDTRDIINAALQDGKTVAVPRCVPGTRLMEFYSISSLDELEKGAFGVDEPLPDSEKLITEYNNSICIVPGLVFDKSGFRLGYGKGYYDRFLANFSGNIIGICYSSCIQSYLITGRFDRKCSLVVTERGVISTKNKNNKSENR